MWLLQAEAAKLVVLPQLILTVFGIDATTFAQHHFPSELIVTAIIKVFQENP